MRYAILPDNAGYWVKSGQTNPLPIDWVQGTELNKKVLVDRVITALSRQRGRIVVIVSKVRASTLAKGFTPLPNNTNMVVQYVRSHLNKVGETKFFELYR